MTTTTTIDVKDLLPWSKPIRVETRNGPRMLSKAPATPEFWDAWRQNKETLRAAGVSVGQNQRSGDWEVCHWQPVPAEDLAAEKARVEASRATDAAIEVPRPEGLDYMPFQRAGIAFARSVFEAKKGGVLIGDEMGLGKTIQAIGIVNADPTIKKVLVICPATLKLNWQRELNKWLTRPLRVAVQHSDKPWAGQAADVLIANYDIAGKFKKELVGVQWDLLVVDECHYLKNPKAQRTQLILGSSRNGEDPIPAKRRVYMTGTPICNRPKELWTLVHSLAPETFVNFFSFAKRYCDAKHNGFGWDFSGASNLDELQAKLRGTIMVRRLKKEVLTELPPKRRQVIELPCEGHAAELVEQQLAEAKAWEDRLAQFRARLELAKVNEDAAEYAEAIQALKEGAAAAFEEGAKTAHEVALAKVPYVIEHIRECIEGGKVILFAHHLDVVAKFCQAFGDAAVKVTGEVSYEARQAAVDRFQSDETCRVFVGGIHAAGLGLTLTASSHVVFAELDWVPGNMSQAEDRAHRIGQANSVLVQHLVLEGSLDAHIARTLVHKQDVIDAALDRRHAEREMAEVLTPTAGNHVITLTVKEIEDEAPKLSAEQVAAIHLGLQMLAGVCDGAATLDNCGFNKMDAYIGHRLAACTRLSPKQAVLGQRLCRKYRRQLPAELLKQAL